MTAFRMPRDVGKRCGIVDMLIKVCGARALCALATLLETVLFHAKFQVFVSRSIDGFSLFSLNQVSKTNSERIKRVPRSEALTIEILPWNQNSNPPQARVWAGAARPPATALGARRIKLTWPLTLTVWRAPCILLISPAVCILCSCRSSASSLLSPDAGAGPRNANP